MVIKTSIFTSFLFYVLVTQMLAILPSVLSLRLCLSLLHSGPNYGIHHVSKQWVEIFFVDLSVAVFRLYCLWCFSLVVLVAFGSINLKVCGNYEAILAGMRS
jgi:hypothetical protein